MENMHGKGLIQHGILLSAGFIYNALKLDSALNECYFSGQPNWEQILGVLKLQ